MTKYLFILALFAILLLAQCAQEEENIIPEEEKVIDEKDTEVLKEDDAIDEVDKTFRRRCSCKCYYGRSAHYAIRQCRYRSYCKLFSCGHYGKKCCNFVQKTCPCQCVSKYTAYRQCKYKKHCHVTRCYGHGYGHYPRYKCCGRH